MKQIFLISEIFFSFSNKAIKRFNNTFFKLKEDLAKGVCFVDSKKLIISDNILLFEEKLYLDCLRNKTCKNLSSQWLNEVLFKKFFSLFIK